MRRLLDCLIRVAGILALGLWIAWPPVQPVGGFVDHNQEGPAVLRAHGIIFLTPEGDTAGYIGVTAHERTGTQAMRLNFHAGNSSITMDVLPDSGAHLGLVYGDKSREPQTVDLLATPNLSILQVKSRGNAAMMMSRGGSEGGTDGDLCQRDGKFYSWP